MARTRRYMHGRKRRCSPLKTDNTPLGPDDGDNSEILKKHGWSGKTRDEAKKEVRFSTSNQTELQKKRDFYKIYGTVNR